MPVFIVLINPIPGYPITSVPDKKGVSGQNTAVISSRQPAIMTSNFIEDGRLLKV